VTHGKITGRLADRRTDSGHARNASPNPRNRFGARVGRLARGARSASGLCLAIVGSTLALCLAPGPIDANAIYQHVGKHFDSISDGAPPEGAYTTAMRITGSIEFAASLGPDLDLANLTSSVFSFSDGRKTLTDVQPVDEDDFDFFFSTDPPGFTPSLEHIDVRPVGCPRS
jgi:hypothetical protein